MALAETLKSLLLTNERDSDLPASPSTRVIDIFREYLCGCYRDLQLPSSLPWPGSLVPTFVELDLRDVPLRGDMAGSKQVALKIPV